MRAFSLVSVPGLCLLLAACGGATRAPGPPDEPPRVRILGPPDGTTFVEGEPFLLVGEATDPEEGMLFGHFLEWRAEEVGVLDDGETARAALWRTGAHTITLTATDRQGNTATDTITVHVTYGIASPEQPGDLVITEIMPNPAQVHDRDGEWFELYNPGPRMLDLEGLVVRDDGIDHFTIENPVLVPADDYVVLCVNANRTTNGGVPVDYAYDDLVLANTADELVLEWRGTEIDRVAYTRDWPFEAGGAMQRRRDMASGLTSWSTATDPYGAGDRGTPGQANNVGVP